MQTIEEEQPLYTGVQEAEGVLRWAVATFYPAIALSTSYEQTVLVHMLSEIQPGVRVISLDTGRLPEETYRCAAEAERRFGYRTEWYFPDTAQLERLVRQEGPYSFKESLEARRACCRIRKVEPLNRALKGLRAWITGMQRGDGASRRDVALVERDAAHGGIVKINPLAFWSGEQVRAYIARHHLPYNRLYDRGYSSIGCSCCTRAVQPGEEPRAGRWWWEQEEFKECGLHI
jgi:phosphoadenosine phosphosulfate reductase